MECDIDTVVLAFENTDRREFFGALNICHKHGVNTTVHQGHADQLLTSSQSVRTLVNLDVEPWDTQDCGIKRAFDIVFAGYNIN